MHHALTMRVLQGLADLQREVERLVRLQRNSMNDMLEVRTIDKLHDEKQVALLRAAKIINGHNAWMLKAGECLGLTLKPADKFGGSGEFRREELDGYRAVQ